MVRLPASPYTRTIGFANNGTVIFTLAENCDAAGGGTQLTESDLESIATLLSPYLGSPRSIIIESPTTVYTYTGL